jgi:hypothetical protein
MKRRIGFTRTWSLAAFAVAALTVTARPAAAQIPFNNFNTYGVINGPIRTTEFVVPANFKAHITQLVDYHWNNGRGARPGSISLKGKKGYFKAFAVNGSGGAPQANWVANINESLDPDTYTILDSDLFTWSQNPQSGGMGFARVNGTLASAPSQPTSSPSANSCPAQYPNCSCKGPGCTHPDLTAYGGNGPIGMTSPKSIHRSVTPAAFAFIATLSAATPVSSYAQTCSTHYHGQLQLLDDEPWYYYYSGYYARFGCAR